MNGRLKRSVIGHLQARRLTEEQLRRLERLQAGARKARPWRRLGLAAAVLLVLGLAALIGSPESPADRALQIADEVALNHLKQRPLEVHGGASDELQTYFDELGFRLLLQPQSLGPQDALLGGRYCSIRGVTAAQLRLRDETGRVETLYQAPYDRDLFGRQPDVGRGETPRRLQVRGLTVELWVERGLLFALARE